MHNPLPVAFYRIMDEPPVTLPGRCTDITFQKKKADRVSLFVEGEYLGSYSYYIIQASGLRKGDIVTEKTFKLLQRDETRNRLKDQMYRWLSVRNHSSGELFIKSKQKGYSPDEIAVVTQEFIEKGLLDDLLFARQFAESKTGAKSWGPVKIRMALSQKGIKKLYIDQVLETLYPDGIDDNVLIDAARGARKRLMRVEPGFKRKKKLADFLIRRGFPGSQVYEKADDVLKQLENEET